jgi:scyllo-inositol 2-dehydrogenase (NADP+)
MAAIGEEAPPLRVGIVGYGLAGTVFHAPLISSTPGMAVAAIVTADQARQAKAARDFPQARLYASSDAMLADAAQLDLVVVATPNRFHVPIGVAALEAGLPVVIDKPVAPSVAEAERLGAAAERAGKLLSVFQNRRWDGDFITLRRLIEGDALGKVVRLESRFERFRPAPNADAWRERTAPEEGGGLLFDLGAHLVDQAMVLFGRPVSVYAEADTRRPGATIDDDTFVALRFAGGQTAHLWMSVLPRKPAPRYRVVGLRGVYEKDGVDPQEDALRLGGHPDDEGWGEEPPESWGRLVTEIAGMPVDGRVETAPGSYETYYALVRDAIRAGGPPPVSLAEAVAVLRVIESARESAQRSAIISLS